MQTKWVSNNPHSLSRSLHLAPPPTTKKSILDYTISLFLLHSKVPPAPMWKRIKLLLPSLKVYYIK